MVVALQEVEGSDEPLKRIQPFRQPTMMKLLNFVTKSTINFFTILGIPQDFCRSIPVIGHVMNSTKEANVLSNLSELLTTWPNAGLC